jgi:hypothetical protein
MTLSPAAQAIWDAFNEDEDVLVFVEDEDVFVEGEAVDYGDKLAAALRALAIRINGADHIRQELVAIAAELEDHTP